MSIWKVLFVIWEATFEVLIRSGLPDWLAHARTFLDWAQYEMILPFRAAEFMQSFHSSVKPNKREKRKRPNLSD